MDAVISEISEILCLNRRALRSVRWRPPQGAEYRPGSGRAAITKALREHGFPQSVAAADAQGEQEPQP